MVDLLKNRGWNIMGIAQYADSEQHAGPSAEEGRGGVDPYLGIREA